MQSEISAGSGSGFRLGRRLGIAACCAAILFSTGGCTLTRAQKLERKAERIESSLVKERDKAVALRATDALGSSAKLDHLTTLRGTLSVANGALAAVPYVFKDPERDLAYDVLDEVYGTIEWNIPLLPGDSSMRAMPTQFTNGRINLAELKAPAAQ